MNIDSIDRVFGRGRQKMATGDHVEVYREAASHGARRRYTKRFLATGGADFRQWTDREWRILARLIGHGVRCVPAVVQYQGGNEGGVQELQTYDAGISVDHWATLVTVERDGARPRNVFADCAHWWSLAHHCIAALEEIHALHLVHLDIKADNLCVPYGPAQFDPDDADGRLHVDFARLALIDFAFSLVSRESLVTALPIGWQTDYDYQSPRLLRALEAGRDGDLLPTQELDWRCDLYSLAAMLRRYLPDDVESPQGSASAWTEPRRHAARALLIRMRECHDADAAEQRPHRDLMALTGVHVGDPDLVRSIAAGWTLVREASAVRSPVWRTPLTRVVDASPPTNLTQLRTVTVAPRDDATPSVFRETRPTPVVAVAPPPVPAVRASAPARPAHPRARGGRIALAAGVLAASVALVMLADEATTLVESTSNRVGHWIAAALEARARDNAPGVVPPVVAEARSETPAQAAVPQDTIADDTTDVTPPRSPAAASNDARSADAKPSTASGARTRNPAEVGRTVAPRPAPRLPAERAPVVIVERSARPVAVSPSTAQATDRAIALLAAPAQNRAGASYDPIAAQRATDRLAMLATRPAPSRSTTRAAAGTQPQLTMPVPSPQVGSTPEPAVAMAKPESPPREVSPPEPVVAERRDAAVPLSSLAAVPRPFPRAQAQSDVAPPIVAAPVAPVPRATTVEVPDENLASLGRRIVTETVPVVAAVASADAAVSLGMVSGRSVPGGVRAYLEATDSRWRSESSSLPPAADAVRVRELYDTAHDAYRAGRRNDAVEYALRALAAKGSPNSL